MKFSLKLCLWHTNGYFSSIHPAMSSPLVPSISPTFLTISKFIFNMKISMEIFHIIVEASASQAMLSQIKKCSAAAPAAQLIQLED